MILSTFRAKIICSFEPRNPYPQLGGKVEIRWSTLMTLVSWVLKKFLSSAIKPSSCGPYSLFSRIGPEQPNSLGRAAMGSRPFVVVNEKNVIYFGKAHCVDRLMLEKEPAP
ncbi:hypothetical protein Ddc_05913 [Ditylenchus destructor]|nr:hypothetical protein Ddc_05913 [Ditylenchus destructor]